MAHVTVQVAVSSVSGNESAYAGKVFKGWETYSITVKGESITKKRLWTFWLENPQPNIAKGDIVEFSGELGSKASQLDRDGNAYLVVEHSVNAARAQVIRKIDPATSIQDAPAFTGESPF